MKEITIKTTDETFLQELKEAKIPDIEIWEPLIKANLPGNLNELIGITINILTSDAAGFLLKFIHNHLRKSPDSKTTINGKPITINITFNDLKIIINYPENNQEYGNTEKE